MGYSVIFIVGGALQAIGTNIGMLYAGRFFAGFGIGKKKIKSGYFPYKETVQLKPGFLFLGANSCLVPIYIAEISPQNLRGKLGTLWQG
jgi:MFS family permease